MSIVLAEVSDLVLPTLIFLSKSLQFS